MNAAMVAKMFGCTEEQARAQYMANAKQVVKMAEKARVTGKKVNGYTEAQLNADAFKLYAKAVK